eukprot:NODE_127_length_18646_cov_0.421632.p3 type:complete len:362 gc:universal NODE_127_length_18646_cov_0.421632:5098-4013(-)
MKSLLVDTENVLNSVAKELENFGKILFCDCEGDSLGRKPDSLTSVQIYDPESKTGYFIDVLVLKKKCSSRLTEVLKVLFENRKHTFVFYDPKNDYLGIRELGIEVTNLFCMKIACKSKSLQHLIETKGCYLPWDIYEWLLEKHESRISFAKKDYSDIVERPLKESHFQMALKDALYLHTLFEKENLHEKLAEVTEKTMASLPEKIQKEKNRANSTGSQRPPFFNKNNLIPALKNNKLRWLAWGYIGTRILTGTELSEKEKKAIKFAIYDKSMNNFDTKVTQALKKLYSRCMSNKPKNSHCLLEKPKDDNSEDSDSIQLLKQMLQESKLENAIKSNNKIVQSQITIIKNAIITIDHVMDKNK